LATAFFILAKRSELFNRWNFGVLMKILSLMIVVFLVVPTAQTLAQTPTSSLQVTGGNRVTSMGTASSFKEALEHPEETFKIEIFDPKFEEIPLDLSSLTKVKEIIIRGTKVSTIPASIAHCVALEVLDLPFNKISKVSATINGLKQLRTLNLAGNRITAVDDHVFEGCLSLRYISLRGCGISALPSGLASCLNLKELDVSENELKAISNSLGYLRQITSLNVSGNKLKSLPGALCSLSQIRVVDASHNEIESFPSCFLSVSGFGKLLLNHNKIKRIPDSLRMSTVSALELDSNLIAEIPESIGNLKSLERLSLVGNQLTTLPEGIGGCVALAFFDVRGNFLETLPVKQLTSLKSLMVFRLANADFKDKLNNGHQTQSKKR